MSERNCKTPVRLLIFYESVLEDIALEKKRKEKKGKQLSYILMRFGTISSTIARKPKNSCSFVAHITGSTRHRIDYRTVT